MILLAVGLWTTVALIFISTLTGVARKESPGERIAHVIIGGLILGVLITAALTIGGMA